MFPVESGFHLATFSQWITSFSWHRCLYGSLLVAICTAVMGLSEPKQCMPGLQEAHVHEETKTQKIPLPTFATTEFCFSLLERLVVITVLMLCPLCTKAQYCNIWQDYPKTWLNHRCMWVPDLLLLYSACLTYRSSQMYFPDSENCDSLEGKALCTIQHGSRFPHPAFSWC